MREESLGERQGPLGVGPVGGQLAPRGRLEQQRRRRDRRAQTAEPAAQGAAQVQHPEVEPRGGLDEDAIATATYSVSMAIASRSRGPAVLSTITCSRANSAADLVGRDQVGAGGQDRGLEHRVARPIEAEELPPEPAGAPPGSRSASGAGVSSIDATSSSRQEQAASSTAPRTTVAGAQGNCGLEMAPWAKSMTSSVRLTTADAGLAHVPEGGGLEERLEDDACPRPTRRPSARS